MYLRRCCCGLLSGVGIVSMSLSPDLLLLLLLLLLPEHRALLPHNLTTTDDTAEMKGL